MAMPRTMVEAAAALRDGHLTSVELVDMSLQAIDAHNPSTHAFIRINAESARAEAQQADQARTAGEVVSPLHGLPVTIKDLIDVAGQPTTAASRVFADRIAATDAVVTTRLKQAGAILLGKTNLHEFALGTTSEDSAYGPVLHPQDLTRSAGGSSGGSAVAVAMGMGFASVGSDTGGSIRIPAAACGLVGLKPSVRDVPTTGVVPLSVTLDHIGPLARSVQDAAWLWSVLAGQPLHTTQPVSVQGLRLGVLGGYFSKPIEAPVAAAFAAACEALTDAGAVCTPVTFEGAGRIIDTYVNLVLPEGAHWHGPWLDSRKADYSPTVHDRLQSGRGISATAYLDARHERILMRRSVDALLASVDALVLPTLPILAPRSGQQTITIDGTDLPVRLAMLKHTQLFNITGHPAITLPLPTPGLPCGLQLVGPMAQTPRLLDVAAACETLLCR